MLTMTPKAAEAVKVLVDGSPFEDEAGLRIAPGEPTPQGTPLNLSIAPAPEPADQTVETDGATLFVEPAAAEALDEMVLDARIEQEQVQFMLKDAVGIDTTQSENGAGPAA
jgi:Fe-S cluster assembly iron-binding protein IscA